MWTSADFEGVRGGGGGALLRSDRRGTRAAAEARISDAAAVLGGQAFVVHSPEGPLPAPPLVDFPLFLRHHQERARGNERKLAFLGMRPPLDLV